jgi:UDPglucose 6-dehydrogenase
MSEKLNIGVIGYGFLGTAIVHGFGLHANIKIYDKFKAGFDTLEDTVNSSEIFFICLPTPMFEDGTQDLSIVDSAIGAIHDLLTENTEKIIVIKSTVLPGTNRKLQEKYPKVKFVSNPEFLTARNNRLDFICASRNILGGDEKYVNRVDDLYKHRFGNSLSTYKTTWETAETVKYTANCFFAVKVSYFNFIYDICEKLNVKYEDVKDMVLADGRIGRSHCDVISGSGVSDNKRQYGGHCFPKDINALINFSKELGLNPRLLNASWEQNVDGRPEKDWEKLPGVISKKTNE